MYIAYNLLFLRNGILTKISLTACITYLTYYHRNKVLQISSSIDHIGNLNLELAACLIVLWIAVYFCIWRGVQWTSKVS